VAAGLFEFDDVEGRVRNKILELEGEFRGLLTGLVQRAVDADARAQTAFAALLDRALPAKRNRAQSKTRRERGEKT
jgi:hypothetical protein